MARRHADQSPYEVLEYGALQPAEHELTSQPAGIRTRASSLLASVSRANTSPPVSDVSCSIENRRFAASIAANRTDPAHRLFALGNVGSMIKCCTTTVFSDFGPDAQDTVKYSARAGLKLP
jgi:hypothetical protein